MDGESVKERLLFERLIDSDRSFETDSNEENRIEALLDSITTHLKRIFNTRQGTVPCDPNYGLPDFSNLPSSFKAPDTELIETSIRSVISAYEKRLEDVQVQFTKSDDKDLAIRFELSATIHTLDRIVPFRLKSRISQDSKFNIDLLR